MALRTCNRHLRFRRHYPWMDRQPHLKLNAWDFPRSKPGPAALKMGRGRRNRFPSRNRRRVLSSGRMEVPCAWGHTYPNYLRHWVLYGKKTGDPDRGLVSLFSKSRATFVARLSFYI